MKDKIEKCGRIDGKIVYCYDFTQLIDKIGDSPEGSPVDDRSAKIGKVTGTFNRCPFCMEWIGVGS